MATFKSQKAVFAAIVNMAVGLALVGSVIKTLDLGAEVVGIDTCII